MERTALSRHVEVQGVRIPTVGFGTWQLHGAECREGVRHALELGYRHIDTARMYRNEREVGEGISESGVDRDDIFLVTKIPSSDLRRADVHRETERSLRELRTDRIDLLLIHWPNADIPLDETLDAMLEQRERDHVVHIGVSNFSVALLEEALQHAPILANQVPYQPGTDVSDILAACERHDITLTAYSPVKDVLGQPALREIADAHGRTPAQVAIRWLIQQPKVTTIPRSKDAQHRAENLEVFDFELSDEEMARLAA